MLSPLAALLKGHELGRGWGAVAHLARVEPYGSYFGLANAGQPMVPGRAFAPGVLHYLGTKAGTCPHKNPHTSNEVVARRSTCPSSGGGKAEALVQHGMQKGGSKLLDCWTDDRAGSWVSVDLGAGRTLCPEAYAVRTTSHHRGKLRHWQLQGSDDGVAWVTLRRHADDTMLVESPHAQASWDLDAATVAGRSFRHVRLLQTGPPSGVGGVPARGGGGTPNVLHCSGLELYGGLDMPESRKRRARRTVPSLRFLDAHCEVMAADPGTGVAYVKHPTMPSLGMLCRTAALLPQSHFAAARTLATAARRRRLRRSQNAQAACHLMQAAVRFFLRLRRLRKKKVQQRSALLLKDAQPQLA
eukprot:1845011-Prymnesium_polylepis.1